MKLTCVVCMCVYIYAHAPKQFGLERWNNSLVYSSWPGVFGEGRRTLTFPFLNNWICILFFCLWHLELSPFTVSSPLQCRHLVSESICNMNNPGLCTFLLFWTGVCCCCSALRPRYKRLVDNIFPEDPKVIWSTSADPSLCWPILPRLTSLRVP